MVFQRFNLFPHMTALENIIEAPIQVRGQNADEARSRSGWRCWRGSGSGHKTDAYPASCRAGSSSASRSRGRWR